VDRAEFYREARSDLPGPIHDLRVLECTTTWAGPMAGCILADFGADVIKVELPEGEVARRVPPMLPGTTTSFMHETVNRNKRCLSLDLRTDAGRELFLEVARTVDVVIENFLPGTLRRWGLGYEDVRMVKGDIVYVSISGWGQYGPWSDRPGYDPLVQAASGLMALNAEVTTGIPSRVPVWFGDDLSGLHAALAALAALRHRDTTGEGQYVDVSMLDVVLFQSNGNLTLGAIGEPLVPWGAQLPACVPGNAFRCRDDRFVYTGCILETHWARFCRLLGRPELVEEPGWRSNVERIANREAVHELFEAWCAAFDRDELLDLLAAEGLPGAPVRSYDELADDPHVHSREMLIDVELQEGGKAPLTGPAVKFSRTPTAIRTPAPSPGQHTRQVLTSVGVEPERFEQLRLDGVV